MHSATGRPDLGGVVLAVALSAVSCAPSREYLAERIHRGAEQAEVIAALGEPPARLRSDDVFLKWASEPCRRDRIAEVWPFTYRLAGSVVVFFDSAQKVECLVRTDDVGDGMPAIVRSNDEPPNDELQELTRSARVNEWCGPCS